MSKAVHTATVPIARHPVHSLLKPVPIVCFTGALVTDIAYWKSANVQWANFSAWLLCVGMLFAVLATLAGLVDFRHYRAIPRRGSAWLRVVGIVLVLVLALFNNFVHSGDGWTAVVPAGLILSGATVLAMLGTAILGRPARYTTPERLR